jgi:hypothetical protein
MSFISSDQDLVKQDNLKHLQSNLTCQKLFYNEHTVVNSLLFVKKDITLGNN